MIDTQTGIAEQLTTLFQETGNAHHKAFIATNGDDPEWPMWHAEYLRPKVNALLSATWTKSELVYLLLLSEKERTAQTPAPSWPEFYATVFQRERRS